ncbi:hypothetical protein ACFO4N_15105 [Camelliibacillus cellulosilyticus]|uniref:DUF4871 domain-containing protein n=1 Tax=Camelliibacillus cellulosilyticus TaxID=2174486 RepID=A0ABV9GP59_9BACL
MMAYASIITVLALIGIIALPLFYRKQSLPKPRTEKAKLFPGLTNGRKALILVIAYLALLLIATGIYTFLPIKQMAYHEDLKQAKWEYKEVENALRSRNISAIKPQWIKDKWERNYPYKKLTIALKTGDDWPITAIVIEEKSTSDKKITGAYILTKVVDGGIDITQIIEPDTLEWANLTLTIASPPHREINLAMDSGSFIASQFTGQSWDSIGDKAYGQPVLLLQIPKDLQVVYKDDLDIQYAEPYLQLPRDF